MVAKYKLNEMRSKVRNKGMKVYICNFFGDNVIIQILYKL